MFVVSTNWWVPNEGKSQPYQQEQQRWEEDKAILEKLKVKLKLNQESMDEEKKIIDEIDASLKRLTYKLSYWEVGSYLHDPGPEKDGEKSTLVNEESPTRIKERTVATCHMDGGAESALVQIQGKG